MFGYLNLGNPKRIGDTESQEMKNCRIDQGYLEYATFATNQLNCRSVLLPNGKTVTQGDNEWPKWASAGVTPAKFGLDKPDSIINNPLNPSTIISRLPTVAAVAYGSQPYAAGSYTYGITLYDPATGEESMPALIPLVIGANQVAQFTAFPAVNDIFPGRSGLQWLIYRMPLGGSELLLVNHATTISANAIYAGPYQDSVEDYNLGQICDSTDNGVEPLRTIFNTSIIFFNDMLFIGGSDSGNRQRIRFSKQGEWWAFPPENELNMPTRGSSWAFRGFAIINETLVMFGDAGISVLYGDNVNNFAVKPVDFETVEEEAVIINSPKAVSGLVLFPTFEAEPFIYNGVNLGDVNYLRSYLAFDGSRIRNISEKIKNLVLVYNAPVSPAGVSLGAITEQGITESRFLAFKFLDITATLAAAANPADIKPGEIVWLSLVLDTQVLGWSTTDDSGKFYYRTKEFSQPRQVQFHKTIWVEAEGEFTIEVYGDNKLVSSVLYDMATKEMIYLNIKPRRYSSFSFRFIGEPGCKIYDYGVDE
jgi:hypothetical protein